MCMFVYIYMYIYICIYACMHMYKTCMYVNMHNYTDIYLTYAYKSIKYIYLSFERI